MCVFMCSVSYDIFSMSRDQGDAKSNTFIIIKFFLLIVDSIWIYILLICFKKVIILPKVSYIKIKNYMLQFPSGISVDLGSSWSFMVNDCIVRTGKCF